MINALSKNLIEKIISLQNYNDNNYPTPYILKRHYKQQEIIEIGVHHSRDQKNTNYTLIEKHFNHFKNKYQGTKSLALIENYIPKQILAKKEMISGLRESGFLVWLANKNNIQTFCPEPSHEEIIKLTHKHFAHADELLLWIFINMLTNYLQNDQSINKGWLDNIMRQISEVGKLINIKKSIPNYLKDFGKNLAHITNNNILFRSREDVLTNNFNTDILKNIQDPSQKKTILNKVAADINIIRDAYILDRKIELLRNGYNIFSVFGKNHVVCQEPGLPDYIQ